MSLDQIAGSITPIIDTFRAESLGCQPNSVRQRYEPNAERYFANEAVRRMRDNLVQRLSQGRRALGYLLGDYGHGKTAAAIYLWRECERQGVCAVPPFQFTSFDDLVEAVIGWLREALRDRDAALLPRAEELYGRYRHRSVEHLAESIARRHGIPLETAREIVLDDIAQHVSIGRAGHLADFLTQAARLAVEGGYRSLCVFADEMQIFIEAGEVRDNIEDLRQLVLALRAEEAPLGLIFILHERVGMVVQQNAGDAMQRLQDDGAGLNLGQYREATFPRRLLEHLCRLAEETPAQVADEAVMEALGQISLRPDLSNGPRSVAAAMRCIARHHAETGRPYRVWDLVRDYEQRNLVFDGVDRSLSGAMAQLLSDDVVRQDARYAQVIQFLCVFPDGAPEAYLTRYALTDALEELAQRRGLLGTVIYAPRADHWALKALQQDPGGEDRITAVVRLFRDDWWYRHSHGSRIAVARQAFAKLLLPELFPRRGQGDAGRKFAGHLAFGDPFDRNPGEVLLTGSFETTVSRFPERRVALAVGTEERALQAYRPSEEGVHLAFVFRLDSLGEAPAEAVVSANQDPRLDFTLNLDANVGGDYPPELNLLRDSIVPRQCTACVLLNLLFYIEDRVPHITMPDADREQVREYLMRSARRVVEQMLFPSEGVQALGLEVRGRGRQQLEGIFAAKLTELYPRYHPVQTGPEARFDLERYTKLLKEGGLSLPVKRGQRSVRLSSRDLLARMGAGAGSQFDAITSRLRRLHLLEVHREESQGGLRYAEFTLTEHPLEKLLRQQIEASGATVTVRRGGRDVETRRLPLDALRRVALREGYVESEFQSLTALACWRQWLEVQEPHVLIAVPDDDPEALQREVEELEAQLRGLTALDAEGAGELLDRLEMLKQRLPGALPEVLSEISLELRLLSERFKEKMAAYAQQLQSHRAALRRLAADLLRRLPTSELAHSIHLAGAVSGVLEVVRQKLERRVGRLRAEIEALERDLAAADVGEQDEPLSVEALVRRKNRLDAHAGALDSDQSQAEALRDSARSLDSWRALASRAAKLEAQVTDRHQDLARRLSDWVDSVVAAFRDASPGNVAKVLGGSRDFEPALEAIERDLGARDRQLRDEYEAYFSRLGDLLTASGLKAPTRVPFDPGDPEQSYAALAEAVTRQLTEAFRRLQPSLADLAAHASFLR